MSKTYRPFVNKKNSLLLLSLGTLAILLTVFFTVNSRFGTQVNASRSGEAKGFLVADPSHVFPCNASAKADYVLRDLAMPDTCFPVYATAATAGKFVGKKVVLTGVKVKGSYYATKVREMVATPSPRPTQLLVDPKGPPTRSMY